MDLRLRVKGVEKEWVLVAGMPIASFPKTSHVKFFLLDASKSDTALGSCFPSSSSTFSSEDCAHRQFAHEHLKRYKRLWGTGGYPSLENRTPQVLHSVLSGCIKCSDQKFSKIWLTFSLSIAVSDTKPHESFSGISSETAHWLTATEHCSLLFHSFSDKGDLLQL